MKTEAEIKSMHELAQALVTSTPQGEHPPEAHVMLWMATGYVLGKPEFAHIKDDAERILKERGL